MVIFHSYGTVYQRVCVCNAHLTVPPGDCTTSWPGDLRVEWESATACRSEGMWWGPAPQPALHVRNDRVSRPLSVRNDRVSMGFQVILPHSGLCPAMSRYALATLLLLSSGYIDWKPLCNILIELDRSDLDSIDLGWETVLAPNCSRSCFVGWLAYVGFQGTVLRFACGERPHKAFQDDWGRSVKFWASWDWISFNMTIKGWYNHPQMVIVYGCLWY
jgi:hypothetical protein